MKRRSGLGWKTYAKGLVLSLGLGAFAGGASQGMIGAVNQFTQKPARTETVETVKPQEPVQEQRTIEQILMTDLNSLEGFTGQELAYLDLVQEFPLAAEAVEEAAQGEENLAFHLARTIVEAGFEPKYRGGKFEKDKELQIVSSAGARGIGAVMPSTFADFKKKHPDTHYSIADLMSYAASLDVGDWRFQERMKKRHGDLVLALLDYNKGHNDVDKLVQKYGKERTILAKLRTVAETNRKYREPAEYPLRILGIARIYDSVFRKLGIDYEAGLSAEQGVLYQTYMRDVEQFPNLMPDVRMVRNKQGKLQRVEYPKYLVARCRMSGSCQDMLAQRAAADTTRDGG